MMKTHFSPIPISEQFELLQTEKVQKRFFRKCSEKNENGCILWNGATGFGGHGQFFLKGEKNKGLISAARAIWMINNKKKIRKGLFACHKCDNPPCVNPEHIFLGTPKKNARDMIAKGRGWVPALKGENNPFSKLTDNDVIFIRQSYLSLDDLAKILPASTTSIRDARIGKTWKHIEVKYHGNNLIDRHGNRRNKNADGCNQEVLRAL